MTLAATPVHAAFRCMESGDALKHLNHRVSLEFHHADLVSVVRLLAKDMGMNLVVDPAVRGQVTMSLEDVPVKQAFLLVMATSGYEYDWHGGLIIVGSKETIARLSDASGHRRFFFGPIKTLEIPLEHAKADRLADVIKGMYPNLTVMVGGPGNCIVIVGPCDQLLYVQELIKGPSEP